MIQQVMAIYDTKARAFLLPFFCPHLDVGFRAIKAAANSPGHQLHIFSEDFVIFHIGEWDDTTGRFTEKPEHMNLGPVQQLKRPEPVQPAPDDSSAQISQHHLLTKGNPDVR